MTIVRDQVRVLEVAEAFFGSQILFTLNELGAFDALSAEPHSASELATKLGADQDALDRILRAGVAQGLITRADGRYANTELAERVLVRGREGYLGNWLRQMARWMKLWVHLTDAAYKGGPVADPQRHLGADADATRDFIAAMDDYARLRGREIVDHLDLSGVRSLLDVGGGPGTYSILFTQRWPELRATIFDLPAVTEIARENAAKAGVPERIDLASGNYHEDDFGGPYDVVFISDTLHQEDAATCQMILDKAFTALRQGGRLVVQAMFLADDRHGPRWPLMHSLILLLAYGGGRAYTVAETIEMAETSGFVDLEHVPMSLVNVNSLLVGHKPAPG